LAGAVEPAQALALEPAQGHARADHHGRADQGVGRLIALGRLLEQAARTVEALGQRRARSWLGDPAARAPRGGVLVGGGRVVERATTVGVDIVLAVVASSSLSSGRAGGELGLRAAGVTATGGAAALGGGSALAGGSACTSTSSLSSTGSPYKKVGRRVTGLT